MNFFLYYILPFTVVLGILIFFHELGHFLFAKLFDVKVLKFSLGFGPKLIGKTIGETEYLISAVPLGGYVKMFGEDIELEEDKKEKEPVTPEDEARSFNNKHPLKRIAIVLAGPIFNILLALIIFCSYFLIAGNQVMTSEIGDVRKDGPAYAAGLLKGDMIIAIDGNSIEHWGQLQEIVKKSAGKSLEVSVLRHEKAMTFTVIPESSIVKNIFGEDEKTALIGITSSGKYKTVEVGASRAIEEGLKKTWEITELTLLTVVKLFQRVLPIKTLGGPIMIGQLTGQLAKESLSYLVPFTAVISINLGILNLFPIPILDGGLIVFLLMELVSGRPINLKVREHAAKLGFVLLFALMFVVLYNDITRLLE